MTRSFLTGLLLFTMSCAEAPTTLRVYVTYVGVEPDMLRVGGGPSGETDLAWDPGEAPPGEVLIELPSDAIEFDLWIHAFSAGIQVGGGSGRARPFTGRERSLDVEIVPLSCPTVCALETRGCGDVGTPAVCALGSDGCPSWERRSPCAPDTFCVDGECAESCDECVEGAAECRTDSRNATCQNVEGCLRWVENLCLAGQSCLDGTCEAALCEPPSCAVGASECAVGGLRSCDDRDGDGCGTWGLTPCACAGGRCCDREEWGDSRVGRSGAVRSLLGDGALFLLRETENGLSFVSQAGSGREIPIPIDGLADFALAEADADGFEYFYSTSSGRLVYRSGADDRTISEVSATALPGTGLQAAVSGGSIHVFYLDTSAAVLTWAHRALGSSGAWIRENISGGRDWLKVVAAVGAPTGPPSLAAVAQAGSNFELIVYRRQGERPTAAWQATRSSNAFSAALGIDAAGNTHVAFATMDVPGFGYAAVPAEDPVGGLHSAAETESVGAAGETAISLVETAGTWAVSRSIDGQADIFLRGSEGWARITTGLQSEPDPNTPLLAIDGAGVTHIARVTGDELHYAFNRCAL